MAIEIDFPASDGLRAEAAALEQLYGGPKSTAHLTELSVERIAASLRNTQGGQELDAAMALIPAGGRVLDVGSGPGFKTLALAARGFRVSAAEPAPVFCRSVEQLFAFNRLPITVYRVAAEYLDRIPDRGFDACLFNASLHHCDDPALALVRCHELLAPGGRVFLLNEPVLHAYRSKRWFMRQLDTRPELGHYGGNEHVYYHGEYVRMLRAAGFGAVAAHLAPRYADPGTYLRERFGATAGGWRRGVREVWYRAVGMLGRGGALGGAALAGLQALSVVECYYSARKSGAAERPARRAA